MRSWAGLMLVVALSGCGQDRRAAEWVSPQTIVFSGGSDCGSGDLQVELRVTQLVVRPRSWRVDATVTNRLGRLVGISLPHRRDRARFGLVVLDSSDVAEVEQRARNSALSRGFVADAFEPALPRVLREGEAWAGSFSGPGRLPAGKYVRVLFGRFTLSGDLPSGLIRRFSCVTDYAPRLG